MKSAHREIRYLSSAAVELAAPTLDAVREAIERIFFEKAEGKTFHAPKLALDIGPGHSFQALAAASPSAGLALEKWCGVAAGNAARGLPNVTCTIILNDLATGQPVAIMNGAWITGIRTAAMTAAAARHLARPDSRSIGFIGCGVQARSHLAALARVLPALARVTAYSRTRASAEGLAAEAQAMQLDGTAVSEPRAAITGMDVVVTSVPASIDLRPFLDPAWLAPGTFAACVDLGRSWKRDNWRESFAVIATDDHAQSLALGAQGKLAFPGPFDADLAELITGRQPARRGPQDRAVFVFGGMGLADLPVAAAVYEIACARDHGIRLPW